MNINLDKQLQALLRVKLILDNNRVNDGEGNDKPEYRHSVK
jgi:hypothetical protein